MINDILNSQYSINVPNHDIPEFIWYIFIHTHTHIYIYISTYFLIYTYWLQIDKIILKSLYITINKCRYYVDHMDTKNVELS